MTTRMPAACSAAIAAGVVALIGSAMAMTPAALPSMATKMAVAPSRRSASACRVERAGIDAGLGHDARDCRSRACAPRPMPVTPLPTGESKLCDVGQREPALLRRPHDGGRQRMLAAALQAGGQAQQLAPRRNPPPSGSPPRSACPRSACRSCRSTRVSTFSRRSSASAFLISTPDCAPRPTPTMIDIGVARPSAHGQAMISTDTAAIRP